MSKQMSEKSNRMEYSNDGVLPKIEADILRQIIPEGAKIVLFRMSGESQMKPGTKGVVKSIDDIGQIHVSWENGSSLPVVPTVDEFSLEF